MKIEVKDLKKLVELLSKESVSLVDISSAPQGNHITVEFINLMDQLVQVKIYQHDSGSFSKIIKEERF
jgi:hypothetical protein